MSAITWKRISVRIPAGLRCRGGFTLLEVLIALAVLSIGAALTLTLVSGSLRNIRNVQLKNRAIQHAETVLELALLDDSIKKPMKRNGDFPDGTRFVIAVDEYPMPPEQLAQLSPEQVQALMNAKIRLFTYTVEVTKPDSDVPDFRLQTRKIVDISEPLQPVGIQR